MRNYTNILFLFIGVLFSQTDTTLTIYGESNLFIGDSKSPELSWISPNGAETYESLDLITLQWSGNDDSFTDESISIYFSQNLGYSFEALEENITNSENYSFNTPDINSAFARFKITAIDYYGNQSEDLSDLYFTIGSPPTWDSENTGGQQEVTVNIESESESFIGDSKMPEITWQYPNGNEEFNQEQSIALSWNGNDDTFNNESISVYYSENLGSPFNIVNENISIDETISLTLPDIDSAFGRFKITATDSFGNSNEDKSDLYFTVGNPNYQEGGGNSTSLTLNIENESNNFTGDSKSPTLEWVYPNGGEQFSDNEIINTQWSAEDDSFGNEAISIYMSNQLGGIFNSVVEDISNTEIYELQLPESEDILTFSRFKVKAVDLFGNTSEDYGNNYFATALTPKFSASTTPEVAYLDQNNQSVQVEFNIEVTSSSLIPSLYEWDFNGDGDYDWSSVMNEPAYYSYTAAGEYAPRVRVTDSDDNTTTVQEIYVVVEEFDVDLAPINEQVSINWGFGSIQTVLVDDAAIEFMNIGDQIHVVDNSGVVRGGCSHLDMLGTITVGSFTYEGQEDLVHPINCYKTYDNCDETGWYSWDYMNYGEVPEFVVYDASEDKYFEGLFTESTPTYRGMSHHILDSLYTGNEVFPNTDFDFLQSTSQSFYYIINASVNGNPIENDDVIGAFRDGICVGYRNWIGNYTDIPVMGNEGGRSYQGYVQDNPIQFLYYNAETEEYTELTPTFEYGEAVFGDETIKINSFDLIRNIETVNYSITESRDDKTYNIYKNQELLVSGISDNEYIDDSIDNDGNYCYEIAIVEDGNEIDMSVPQCIDITLENQYPLGDINGDYNVNVTDVVLLINYILNNESYPAGDINQDGNVNVTDVVLLINMILNS